MNAASSAVSATPPIYTCVVLGSSILPGMYLTPFTGATFQSPLVGGNVLVVGADGRIFVSVPL